MNGSSYPPPSPGTPAPTPVPADSLAITALVLGIVSLIGAGCLTGLPAVICGHISRANIRRSAGQLGGDGMAVAGLVLGYLSIVATVIIVALFGGIIIAATSSAGLQGK